MVGTWDVSVEGQVAWMGLWALGPSVSAARA